MKTAQKADVRIVRQTDEGSYFTDGTRLVQVRRLMDHGVSVEEGDVGAPDVSFLTWTDLEQGGWRAVEPDG